MTTKPDSDTDDANAGKPEPTTSAAGETETQSPTSGGEDGKQALGKAAVATRVSLEKGARAGRARKKSRAKDEDEPVAPPAPAGPVRDETDSFIDEVTEELRRDRLYAMFRRYGPYALALILLLVAGAAVNEYVQHERTERARRDGAVLLAAERADEPAAAYLSAAAETGPGPAMLARFDAAALRAEEGDVKEAASIYRSIAVNDDLSPRFRDLALLKAAMAEADIEDPAELATKLEPLIADGAPYRALALELQGAAYIRMGDIDRAKEALGAAIASPDAPQNLVGRAQAVLDALGAEAGGAAQGSEAPATD